jgi:c-di-GMP-binding flagellar brake protein YcgR
MNDKRREPRKEVYNRVYVADTKQACVRDISLGGMKIAIMKSESVTLPETFSIKILSKEYTDDNIDLTCKIKWKAQENIFINYGLEFINSDKSIENKLKKFIDYLTLLGRKFSKVKIEIDYSSGKNS